MELIERLRVSAYVICADDDGRLLLARWIGYEGPQWTLAGGGLDPGEQPQGGALRELTEETGYTGELEALIGIDVEHFVGVHQVPEGYDGFDFHAVRIVYRGRVTGGELTHEVDGTTDLADWIPRTQVAGLDAVSLVTAGVAMLADPGVPVAPVTPTPAIPADVTVENRVAAYGRTPDGDVVGGLLEHGADPVEAIENAFKQTRGVDVHVVRPRSATSSVETADDGAARWVVHLEYDVTIP